MTWEKEDYMEPVCPLQRPAAPVRQVEVLGRIDLPAVIAECDRLFNANQPEQLGEHLRFYRNQARELRDRESELSILSELMGHYRMNYDPERGMAAIRDGIALINDLGIAGSVSCGTILINAATALQAFGQVEKALEYYSEAFRCYGENLPPEDLRFAGLLNNMAAAYTAAGDLSHAEAYYLKALKVLESSGNLMDTAVTFVNLAQLCYQADKSADEINGMLDKAMACFDSPQAVRDGYYAHTCKKCAPAFGFFDREADEQTLEQRAEQFYAGA